MPLSVLIHGFISQKPVICGIIGDRADVELQVIYLFLVIRRNAVLEHNVLACDLGFSSGIECKHITLVLIGSRSHSKEADVSVGGQLIIADKALSYQSSRKIFRDLLVIKVNIQLVLVFNTDSLFLGPGSEIRFSLDPEGSALAAVHCCNEGIRIGSIAIVIYAVSVVIVIISRNVGGLRRIDLIYDPLIAYLFVDLGSGKLIKAVYSDRNVVLAAAQGKLCAMTIGGSCLGNKNAAHGFTILTRRDGQGVEKRVLSYVTNVFVKILFSGSLVYNLVVLVLKLLRSPGHNDRIDLEAISCLQSNLLEIKGERKYLVSVY